MARVPTSTSSARKALEDVSRELGRVSARLKSIESRITAVEGSSGGVSFGTPVSVSTANAAGSASTAARSDHVHDVQMVHTESFGFIVASLGAWYVPFASHDAENGTPGAIHVWTVPFSGEITSVHIQCVNDAGDITATLRDEALNALDSDTQTAASFTVGAVTDYEATFSVAQAVTAGDKILLGLNFAANPGSVVGWIRLEVA